MSNKTITLKSSDGIVFEVDEAVAKESELIKNMFEDGFGDDNVIPIFGVSGSILAMVIDYCKKQVEVRGKHADAEKDNSGEGKEDTLELSVCIELIKAASRLQIEGLLEQSCGHMAAIIADWNADEIRDLFGIESDFTADEAYQHYILNTWAYEK